MIVAVFITKLIHSLISFIHVLVELQMSHRIFSPNRYACFLIPFLYLKQFFYLFTSYCNNIIIIIIIFGNTFLTNRLDLRRHHTLGECFDQRKTYSWCCSFPYINFTEYA